MLGQRIANILEKALPGVSSDTPKVEVERWLVYSVLNALGHVSFNTSAKYRRVVGEDLREWHNKLWS